MTIDGEDDNNRFWNHKKGTLKRDEPENKEISEMLSGVKEDSSTLPHHLQKETDGNRTYSVNAKELDTTLDDTEGIERLLTIPGDVSDANISHLNKL